MSRPKSKDELLHMSQENFQKLNDLIVNYSQEEQFIDFSPRTMNRNIRMALNLY